MVRNRPLPLAEEWEDPNTYIEALLGFATSNVLFINLCGGVHILDFLTREPDLYATLFPEDWTVFFDYHDIQDIIKLLLYEDIAPLREPGEPNRTWNGGVFPPTDLLEYIYNVRRLILRRDFFSPHLDKKKTKLPRHVATGMNRKKVHEVECFSRYVGDLSNTVEERRGESVSHIVDFGSGQNYLGRTLASAPYHKHIIAIERQHEYISGAKGMDVHANLAEKEKKEKTYYIKNKKKKECDACDGNQGIETSGDQDTPGSEDSLVKFENVPAREVEENVEDVTVFKMLGEISLEPGEIQGETPGQATQQKKAAKPIIDARGTLSYIEHEIEDGYLEPIIDHVVNPSPEATQNGNESEDQSSAIAAVPTAKQNDARVMVVSLHSCGNLVHHGVRSLILNPSVVAVAMIGCCYNLITERLGPATYKLPILRSLHPRLYETGTSYDPHGFPMSKLYENYKSANTTGVKLNITARAMAVQAPYNWGYADSEGFFTRNFFRALLQRILVDRGVVPKPGAVQDLYEESNPEAGAKAIIVGSLRKSAFESFTTYMRAAIVKLSRDATHGAKVQELLATMSDEDFQNYEAKYRRGRKHLAVVWSLMGFSAQIVESLIVVDRWQYLREHDSVKECWVETVFDYSESPRNLAVIGLKK